MESNDFDPEIEPCLCKEFVDDVNYIDSAIKAAALRVSPSVVSVSVILHNFPDDMKLKGRRVMKHKKRRVTKLKGRRVTGSGIIIKREDAEDGTCFGIILAPADLFKGTDALQPHQFEVDVRVSGGKLYKGQLIDSDFHFNIAAIRFQSDSNLKAATIRHLSDVTSIDVDSNEHLQSLGERPFQRQRHPNFNSFNVQSGTKIMIAKRSCTSQYEIRISSGVLSTHGGYKMHRKELFSIKGSNLKCKGGRAVFNYYGEVIGICFSNASFLPFNLVSRWWDHYESFKQFHRPCLGVEVTNLHEASTDFLKEFVQKFPSIVTGVVVTKVEKNSPAHELKCDDVITECDGYSISSKLEFFERVWDNAGGVVKLNVMKASDGEQLNLLVTIPPDKL